MAKYDSNFYGEIEIKPISEIIKQVKSYGTRGWIWDNGKIRDDALVCDIFPILESLEEYEVQLDDEDIARIYEDGDADNTYNWSANISNDLDFRYIEKVGCIVQVHLSGDVRSNYTDFFAIESLDCILQCPDIYQTKKINNRYFADINALSDTYEVYDTETNESVGDFYEIDRNELIKELEEKLGHSINESVLLKEAESYGWVVDNSEVDDAYELACDHIGKNYVNDAIVNTLSSDDLASSLAYLFRMWDFQEWDAYKNGEDIE